MSKSEQKKNKNSRGSKKAGRKSRAAKSRKVAVEELFVDGEKAILGAQIHDAIYWKSVAVFVLAILVALFLAVELGALLAFVSILMFMYALFKKEILQLQLTNKRVFARYGLLQVDVVDIQFSKIESIELERMLPGFVFGYSNVVIMGTGNRYIVIPYVRNALALRRAYNKITLEGPDPEAGEPKRERRVEGKVDLGSGRR